MNIIRKIGHHHAAILAAIVLAGAVAMFDATGWWGTAPHLAVVVLYIVASRAHMASLCEDCAAQFPLDAADQAARQRLALRVAHFGSNGWLPTILLGAGLVLDWLVMPEEASGPVAAMTLGMVGFLFAMRVHNRLQPWCPFCGGGDEDDDPAIAPTPAPAASA